jgi:hypothetical protein
VWLNPNLKVYNTEIHIEGDTTGLRTGMTCLAEIVVEEYPDAVYVPVQAVVRVGGRPTVYLAKGDPPEAREVALGLDNNRMVRILNGLSTGERVLLTPPLAADGDEYAARQEALMDEVGRRDGEEAASGEPGGGQAEAEPPQEERRQDAGATDELIERFRNASPEEREQMRRQFEQLSPEEQQRLMQRMGGDRRGRGGGPGEGRGGPSREGRGGPSREERGNP